MKAHTVIARLVLILTIRSAVAQNTPTTYLETPRPVFALAQAFSSPEVRIDPIFLLSGNHIIHFPEPDETNPRTQALFKKYVRPGARYNVVYGGGNGGSVVVRRIDPRIFPEALVELHSRVPIHGLMALAVDPGIMIREKGSRRKPTSNERARAALVAKSIFRARGVKSSAFARMEFSQIDVLPLNTENLQIVSTVDIMRSDKTGPECTAFFICRGAGPDADVLWYQQPKKDNEIQQLYLLDCIDTDGDEVNELIAMRIYYEAVGYEIYKYSNGGWTKVFSSWIRQEF